MSPKRHCLACRKKWRVRNHATSGRFPTALVIVGVLGALGLFYGAEKLSLKMRQQSTKEIEMPWPAGAPAPEEMGGMDKEEAMQKLKKFRNNPAALSKLDPQKRKMVERALSLTKDQSSAR